MKKILMAIIIVTSMLPMFLHAQSGSIDCSFGKAGKVLFNYNNVDNKIRRIIKQPDGKIIAVGTTFIGSSDAWMVTRFTADGNLDNSFGTGGVFTYDPSASTYDRATNVALQSDGKIIVCGNGKGTVQEDFIALRLNTDGTLDNTFGTSGVFISALETATIDYCEGIAIQSDDKIILAGSNGASSGSFYILRLTANGALDASFNTTGKQSFLFTAYYAFATSVAVDGNGKIVVAGYSNNGTKNDFAIARLTSAGALDATFSGDGKLVVTGCANSNHANAVKVLADNSILVAGYGLVSTEDFLMAKITTAGVLDNTFGTSGIVSTDFSSAADRAHDIEVQADNAIILTGKSATTSFAVARYSSTGAIDNTFGTSGKVTIAVTGTATNYGYDGIYNQSANKLLIGGYANNGSNNDLALAQLFLTTPPLSIGVQAIIESCAGSPNASIDINVCGGTPAYTYSWSNSANTEDITAINAGTYTVTVTDALAGTATASFVINSNPLPSGAITGVTSVCAGTSTTLTAPANSSYAWNTGPTTQTCTVSPGTTSTYTVTVTNSFSCTNTMFVVVNVNTLPIASAGADVAYCQGSSTMLNASGGNTYLWSPATGLSATTGMTVFASPSVNTTYTITATDANGCTDTDDVVVTAFVDFANAGGIQYICNGSVANLNATGGTGYIWSPDGTLSSTNISNPVASPVINTSYYVTVTNAAGCTDDDMAVVQIDPSPTVDAGSNTNLCLGGTTSISAGTVGGTPSYTYVWSPGTGLSSSTIVAPTVTPVSAGQTTYMVTVTDSKGCTASDFVIITTNPKPNIIAPADFQICLGASQPITTTPSGGTPGYTYNWSPATYLSSTVVGSPTVTPGVPGNVTYTVTIADTKGCTGSDAVVVITNPLPTISMSNDGPKCEGSTLGLSSTSAGAISYNWAGPMAFSSTSQNPTRAALVTGMSGMYTVTITSASGCTASSNTTVTVNNLPVATATDGGDVCEGITISLFAGPGGMVSYNWSGPMAYSSALQNPTISNANPGQAGIYTVTVVDANGCTATANTSIIVNSNPGPIASSDGPKCEGESLTLSCNPAFSSYAWSGPNSFVSGQQSSMIGTVLPFNAGVYTVTVTDVNGCTGTSDVNVVVNPLPVANAGVDQFICDGESANLMASGGSSYQWNTAENTASITVSPSTQTTYIVTATSNGCTGSDHLVVTVNALPIAAITGSSMSCQGSPVTLTASGGLTYSWNTTDNTSVIVASPGINTTYTVTVNDANGCSDIATHAITVNPLPTAAITGTPAICTGGATTLSGGGAGAGTYAWSNSSVTQNINVSPGVNTTYTLTITDANGCTDSEFVFVIVNTPTAVTASSNSPVCEGSEIYLNLVPGVISYTWTGPDGFTSVLQNPSTGPSTLAKAGNYTVTITDINGCTNTSSTSVVVNSFPVPDAGIDQTICEGISASLSANGGTSYSWSSGAVTQTTSVSPSITTTYTVTVFAASGCSASDEMVVTVNALPVVNAGVDQTICNGASANLLATGATTYNWSSGAATAGTSVSPIVNTTYTVTGTQTGCTAQDFMVVTVNSLPVANAGVDQAICLGQTANLSASGGTTYNWSNAAPTATTSVTPAINTTYTVTVSNGAGCTAQDLMVVTVNALPNPSITGPTTICNGSSTTLNATGGSTYLWNTSDNTVGITVSPIANITYTVTATAANGCSNTTTAAVTVNALPAASITGTITICNGGNTTLSSSAANTYLWSTSEVTQNVSVAPGVNTTYSVTITGANGCSNTATTNVTVNANPVANAGVDQTICLGQTANLSASGGTTYSWSNAAPTATTSVTPAVNTTYTVTVTNGAGCTAQDLMVVSVTSLPVPSIDYQTNPTCNGNTNGSIALLVSGGSIPYAYNWSNAQTTNTISSLVAGTYTVTVTDNLGCTGSITAVLTEPTVVVAATDMNQSLCAGGSLPLGVVPSGGTAPYTYLWSPSATLDIPTIGTPMSTPAVTTTYVVTVSDMNGCTASNNQIITVDGPVTVYAGVDQMVCASNPVVNLSGAVTVAIGGAWSSSGTGTFSNSLSLISTYTPSAFDIANGTVVLTLTSTGNGSCAAVTDNMSITITPAVTANAGIDQSICASSPTVTLAGAVTVAAGGNWTSSGTGSFSNSSALNATYTPSAGDISTGFVTLTLTTTGNGLCTAVTDDMLLTISAAPAANAGVDQMICLGNSATMTATGGGAYLWNTSANTASITESPISHTTYTVTVDLGGGCTASDEVIVYVNILPTASIITNSPICTGSAINMNADPSGMTSYQWAGPMAFTAAVQNPTIPIASPTMAGIYTVTVTDANGCSDTEQTTIAINTVPVASISGVSSICIGGSTVLTGAGGASYTWSTLESTPSITVSPSINVTYYLTVVDASGCTDTEQHVLMTQTEPSLSISSPGVVCAGADVLFNTTTTANTYNWTGPNAYTSSLLSPELFAVTPAEAGVYAVTVTDASGCTASSQAMLTVNSQPSVIANPTSVSCFGSSNGTATAVPSGGASPYIYSWTGGQTLATATGLSAGSYNVTVTDNNMCTASTSVTITSPTILTISTSSDQVICLGGSATISATPAGGTAAYTYAWSPNIGLSSPVVAAPTASPSVNTTYVVTITDANGCTVTDDVYVNVDPLPMAAITGAMPMCTGGAVNLTATGGTTYQWDDASTSEYKSVSPAVTTTYTITASTGSCTSTATTSVVVYAAPITSVITGNAAPSCNATAVTYNVTLTSGSTYYWSVPMNATIVTGNTGPDNNQITVNFGDINGDVTVVEVSANSCNGAPQTLPVVMVGCGLNASFTSDDSTICQGTVVTFTNTSIGATGGATYDWNFGVSASPSVASGIGPHMVTYSNPGTYDVTLVINDGATDIATKTGYIVVDPTPVVNAGADQSVCADAVSVALAGAVTGASGGVWTSSGTGTFVNSTLLITQYYPSTDDKMTGNVTLTLTSTNNGNCTAVSDALSLVINPIPVANAGVDKSICQGQSASLSADGGTLYTWSTTDNTADITVSPSVTTIYTVTVTGVGFCASTDEVTVSVGTTPITSISSNSPVCAGQAIILNGTSDGATYAWTGPNGFTSTNLTPTISASAMEVMEGPYQLVVTSAAGCKDTIVLSVVVNPIPTPTASSNSPVCENTQLSLMGGPVGYIYMWTGPFSYTSTAQNPVVSALATSAMSGTFNLKVVDMITGCSDSTSTLVIVNAAPVANAGADVNICVGATTDLNGSGIGSYTWSTFETTATIMVSPTSTTTYTLTADAGAGCTSTDEVVVFVNPSPIVSVSATDTICIGASSTLTSSGADSYIWSTTEALASISVSPTTTTTYTVTATDINGCSATATTKVVIRPSVSITAEPVAANACAGKPVVFEVVASGQGIVYQWMQSTDGGTSWTNIAGEASSIYSIPAVLASMDQYQYKCGVSGLCGTLTSKAVALTISSPSTASQAASICQGEVYTYNAKSHTSSDIFVDTLVSSTGCDSLIMTTTLTVNSLLTLDAGIDQTVCSGATASLIALGADTYSWSTGGTTAAVTDVPMITTTYTVIGTDVNGCTATDDVVVTVNVSPTAVLSPSALTICMGNSVTITASGGDSYLWSTTSTGATITDTPADNVTYTLTATALNGCTDSEFVEIAVNPAAAVSIDPVSHVCAGSSVSLSATGTGSYTWSTGATTSVISVTPSAVTTYSVVSDLGAGCSAADTIQVSVGSVLEVWPTADDTVCSGTTTFLSTTATGGAGGYIYTWSDGLGMGQVKSIQPTTTTTYTVTGYDAYGCSASAKELVITVLAIPVINTQPAPLTVCNGSAAMFSVTASQPVNYQWQTSADGVTWIDQAGGNTAVFNIPLTDMTLNQQQYRCNLTGACITSLISDIAILSVADLSATVDAGVGQTICKGASASIRATGADTYVWSTTETKANITVQPLATSVYTVTATDVSGCTATDEVVISISALQADPVITIDTAALTIDVESNSLDATAYQWQFGDGYSTTSPIESHTYNNEGVYNLCLLVEDANGCTDTKCQSIKLGLGLVDAQFAMQIDTLLRKVTLTDTSEGVITSWYWDFGDGTSSNQQNPTHTYASVGAYAVSLTVFNSGSGKMSTISKSFVLGADQVNASYTYVVDGTMQTLLFDDASIGANAWYWSFGDGQMSNEQTGAHTYAKAGVYDVCLTARDTLYGKQAQSCKLIPVGVGLPVSAFIYYVNDATMKSDFRDLSSGYVNAWFWEFGDNKTSLERNPSHTYSKAGLYNVCLTAMDTITKSMSTKCQPVSVGVKNCNADFGFFVDQTTDSLYLTDASVGAVTSWYWTMGDGSYSTKNNVTYAYAEDGKYNVCLFIQEKSTGCVSNACKEVLIGAEQPKAAFNYFVVDSTNNVYFTDNSMGDIDEWFWNFGDGSSSAQNSQEHTYAVAGKYVVSLSVINTLTGEKDQVTMEIKVGNPVCVADFDVSVAPASNTVTFINKSQGSGLTYYWDFDDNNFDETKTPVHKYDQSGIYNVGLTVSGSAGQCMHKMVKAIQVGTVTCEAAFTYHIDSSQSQAHFKNVLLGKSTNTYWEFGDGSFSTHRNPSHKYIAQGYYTVTLNTYDSISQCMDVQKQILLIGSKGKDCQAEFIYQQNIMLNMVTYNVKAVTPSAKYIWDFGDKTATAGHTSPVHIYSKDGYYDVCLTMNDTAAKCKNTSCQEVKIGNDQNSCATRFIYTIDTLKKKVIFENKSIGTMNSMDWEFGDGKSSTQYAPEHVYSKSGYYIVKLTGSNNVTGCSSQFVDVVNMAGGQFGLFAGFGYNVDASGSQKGVLPVEFKGASYGEASEVEWDFGDGSASATSMAPTHNYSDTGSYYVCMTVYDPIIEDSSTYCEWIKVENTTGIEQIETDVQQLGMSTYPNPFSHTTSVYMSIPADEQVELAVYNLTGEKMQTLVSEHLFAGKYTYVWDASQLQAGIYFIQLRMNDQVHTTKIVKLK